MATVGGSDACSRRKEGMEGTTKRCSCVYSAAQRPSMGFRKLATMPRTSGKLASVYFLRPVRPKRVKRGPKHAQKARKGTHSAPRL